MKTTKTYTRDDVIKHGEYLGFIEYESGATEQRWLIDGLVFSETCTTDGRLAGFRCIGNASKVFEVDKTAQGTTASNEKGKTMLHYDLTEINLPIDERPMYPTVRATDDEGHTVSITTNKYGEGKFNIVETSFGTEYKQTRGTLQYKLPATDAGIKRRLNEEYKFMKEFMGW